MSGFDTWPPMRVAGTGAALPERVVTNDEIVSGLDTTADWIFSHTGIRERRFADAGEQTADLAAAAALDAMSAAAISDVDIDIVVLATSTPDRPQPATAAEVHRLLGLRPEAAALDVNAVCSGFVYGLHMASAMVACTDTWTHALVIGADTYSRITDPADRSTRIFFGDGAGAVVLEKTLPMGELSLMAAGTIGLESGAPDPDGGLDEVETPGLRSAVYTVDGTRRGAITVEQHGGWFSMDGPAVKAFAIPAMAEAVRRACHEASITPDDLALIVPHQSNRRILEGAIDELGLPEGRMHVTVDRYGNTAAASIPITLDDAARSGRLAEGDLVCLVGYGGGLASAACVIRW